METAIDIENCFRSVEEAALRLITQSTGLPVSGGIVIPLKQLMRENARTDRRVDFCYPLIKRCAGGKITQDRFERLFSTCYNWSGTHNYDFFSDVSYANGYVNFLLKDDFLFKSADSVLRKADIGFISDSIRIPASIEYVHARLIAYANLNRNIEPSNAQHSSAVLALASLDANTPERRHRLLDSVCKTALIAFKEGKGFNFKLAKLIAASLNLEIQTNGGVFYGN